MRRRDGSALVFPTLKSSTSNRPLYSTTVSKMRSIRCESMRWPSASTTSWNMNFQDSNVEKSSTLRRLVFRDQTVAIANSVRRCRVRAGESRIYRWNGPADRRWSFGRDYRERRAVFRLLFAKIERSRGLQQDQPTRIRPDGRPKVGSGDHHLAGVSAGEEAQAFSNRRLHG